jgi:hypothetical protein
MKPRTPPPSEVSKKGVRAFSNPSTFPDPIRFRMTSKPERSSLVYSPVRVSPPQNRPQTLASSQFKIRHLHFIDLIFPFYEAGARVHLSNLSRFPAPKSKIQVAQKPETSVLCGILSGRTVIVTATARGNFLVHAGVNLRGHCSLHLSVLVE